MKESIIALAEAPSSDEEDEYDGGEAFLEDGEEGGARLKVRDNGEEDEEDEGESRVQSGTQTPISAGADSNVNVRLSPLTFDCSGTNTICPSYFPAILESLFGSTSRIPLSLLALLILSRLCHSSLERTYQVTRIHGFGQSTIRRMEDHVGTWRGRHDSEDERETNGYGS